MNATTREAVELLRRMIAIPSPSRDEAGTADLLYDFLARHGAAPERLHNNVYARSAFTAWGATMPELRPCR